MNNERRSFLAKLAGLFGLGLAAGKVERENMKACLELPPSEFEIIKPTPIKKLPLEYGSYQHIFFGVLVDDLFANDTARAFFDCDEPVSHPDAHIKIVHAPSILAAGYKIPAGTRFAATMVYVPIKQQLKLMSNIVDNPIVDVQVDVECTYVIYRTDDRPIPVTPAAKLAHCRSVDANRKARCLDA